VTLIVLLTLFSCTASAGLWISVRRNLELIDRLEEIDEAIQAASDTLKETHEIIELKSKIEVFYDEPVVRDLLKSIANAKDAVSSVARLLDDVAINQGDQEETEEP
jgi:hypothetical protein